MRLRPLLAAVAVALVGAAGARAASVCASSCYQAPAGSGPLFMFSGHGWGHGIGMSQYGAFGYAQHGWSFQQILAHYYPGTTLSTTGDTQVRVLLADRRKQLTISSTVPFSVTDGGGRTLALAAGPVTFGPGLVLSGTSLTAPLTFHAGAGGPLSLARAYRGQILVDVVDGKLRAVNIVPLEQYLYGVVPAEMPATWSPEALKAQAVAARSYALATRLAAAPYDVYADTRSQMYLGLSVETAASSAAVDATKQQVLMFAGKIATTYFSSSSGGESTSIADAWGVAPVPYLVAVPDPYDTISPYHNWGPVPVTAQKIGAALKVQGSIMDASTTLNGSGRVNQLDLLTLPPFGGMTQTAVPAGTVQGALGLRSTWFNVGVLSLVPPSPAAPIAYGSTVQLTGLVRGVTGVSLEARLVTGTWQPVGPIVPAADGTVTVTEQPQFTTDYRLATTSAAAAYVRIKVTPAVTLASTATPGAVSGSEQPPLPGAPVTVQQQAADGTWTTVATGAVAADGSFSVPVQLGAGSTYRVVVAPGQGWWPATTAALIAAG
jgi:stage II sporulation protein D